MALGLFIPITMMVIVAVYISSFKDEFDMENLQGVWILVGGFLVILFLWAILLSLGSTLRG